MEPQLTHAEFAAKIKAKYPVYQNVDDNELVQKMLVKYPQYKSQITLTPATPAPQVGFFTKLAGAVKGAVVDDKANIPVQIAAGVGSAIAGTDSSKLSLPGKFAADVVGSATGIWTVIPKAIKALHEKKVFHDLTDSQKTLLDVTSRMSEELPKITDEVKRKSIEDNIQTNIKQLGLSQEQVQTLAEHINETAPTVGQVAGKALSAGLTAVLGGVSPTKVAVGEGFVQFIKTAALRALETGSIFGIGTAGQELINEKPIEEVVKNSSIAFGLGALGSGLFSAAITLPVKTALQQKFISSMFRSGLGFPKNVRKSEENANKSAADILIEYGGGTSDQLKNRYYQLSNEFEDQLQKELKTLDIKYSTKQIMGDIRNALQEQFKGTLSPAQIEQRLNTLPLESLRNRSQISVSELNDLRREITNKFLKDGDFIREAANVEGKINALKTASSIMSEKVKAAVPQTILIFERYSAVIKGYDAALNMLAQSRGPVNTGAKIASAGVGGIGGAIAGSAFGPIGTAIGAVMGIGAEELANSTIGRTTLAFALSKAGTIGANLGKSEIVALGNILVKLGIIKAFNPDESGETGETDE